jgi:hypothetical protein
MALPDIRRTVLLIKVRLRFSINFATNASISLLPLIGWLSYIVRAYRKGFMPLIFPI